MRLGNVSKSQQENLRIFVFEASVQIAGGGIWLLKRLK